MTTTFFSFLMDLADELERRGLGVKVKRGTWMGACSLYYCPYG